MKDLFIEDYELVKQQDTRSACGGCVFEYTSCNPEFVDQCGKKINLNKVWSLRQQENETNN